MAEKGAYLTDTVKAKPSIFEIVAQESLASTLEPVFKKIISYLVLVNPHRYGWLERWCDEAYLVFNAALQYHYLKKYSASFSETFYGLKRSSVVAGSDGKLSTKQEKISLLLLVVFPHFRTKLFRLAEEYKLEVADGKIPQKRWQKLVRKLVINGNMIFHVIYECLILYRYLRYMAGRSEYSTPLLWLASVTLSYADGKKFLTITDLLMKIRLGTLTFSNGIDLFGMLFTRSLEFGAFFLQFLRWWNQENYYVNLMALPTPVPPEVPKIALQYKGLCPICRKGRQIPTALPVSGYVFCYQCILKYIREYEKCPITNYPAKEDDLIRLYVE
ncbi:peroxisome assembly protein 12 [Neodiprion lecontei]|uniref:Peroxisome assembly protein 12 n=1 Tax=Neodiprion lecontei TaxID=441921 RepID=A0A6J0BVI3_NEOLC|nr:peroxisome assembly protein 12 [Neodiprion lecontei]XP_046590799.1 peroxisome assembly protein 12 [Neodiprion lecontei]XP_046590800.1 peroxisome assembly protein 12 [Neodiprion lecontei]XP_046590801.1 peroxisome assembly protein 12 [Neodiprion lecontei]